MINLKTTCKVSRVRVLSLVLATSACMGATFNYAQAGDTKAPGVVSEVQNKQTVTGRVVDANGEPLIGVRVMVKGTSEGAITDIDGNYSLKAKRGDVLTFNYVGFKTVEVPVTSTVHNVTMQEDSELLQEVVVVGYGAQKKVNLTGAVSTVDVEKTLESRPVADIGKALQGVTPGLTITSISGQLGNEPTIKLRGATGSLNATQGTAPLILVDNVEVPSLSLVNPDDVESISVLKDAASSSIYGTRAAWGVILITTKKGKLGEKPRVSFSSNFAWSTPTMLPQLASTYDNALHGLAIAKRMDNKEEFGVIGYNVNYAAVEKMKQWEAQYGSMSEEELGEMQYGRDFENINGKYYFYRSFDPIEMFLNKWTPENKQDLSISGGSDKTTYNLGLGYSGQQGPLKYNADRNSRYSFNGSISTRISQTISFRAGMMFSRTNYEQPYRFSSGVFDMWYYLLRWPRFYPYGTYEGKPFRSAVTETQSGSKENLMRSFARVNVGTTITPIKNLDINIDYTYGFLNSYQKRNGGEVWGYDMFNTNNPLTYSSLYSSWHDRVFEASRYTHSHTLKAYGTYQFNINDKHDFKVMAGMDAESRERHGHSSDRHGMISFDKPEIALTLGDQYVDDIMYHNDFAAAGVFGRINYSYADKYLLELNGRYDGSSMFPEGNKWAFFPSGSAGWRVSEESFFTGLKPYFSDFKLRGSWGTIGNQDVRANSFLSVMGVGANSGWLIDGVNVPYIGQPSPISPVLTWERISTLNLGADMRFFNNKLGVTAEWYRRTTSGMHSPGETLPSTFGQSAPKVNEGEMQATGLELALDFNHVFDNGLGINARATFSKVKEVITKYNNPNKNIYGFYEGKVIGEIWGYETDRFFTEDDFKMVAVKDKDGNEVMMRVIDPNKAADQSLYESGSFKFGPGDIKYKDLNGDGVISHGSNTLDDHGDLKVIGNSLPNFEYGFTFGANWKGLDMSIFFQGVGKRDVWPVGAVGTPGFGKYESVFEHQLDYWTPENPNAFYPRPSDNTWNGHGMNFLRQTKYLQSMAYLRLKNLTIGYTLPKEITQKAYIQNARIYFSGENLFEFYNGHVPIDPESSTYKANSWADSYSIGRTYPFMRTLSIGAQLTF